MPLVAQSSENKDDSITDCPKCYIHVPATLSLLSFHYQDFEFLHAEEQSFLADMEGTLCEVN